MGHLLGKCTWMAGALQGLRQGPSIPAARNPPHRWLVGFLGGSGGRQEAGLSPHPALASSLAQGSPSFGLRSFCPAPLEGDAVGEPGWEPALPRSCLAEPRVPAPLFPSLRASWVSPPLGQAKRTLMLSSSLSWGENHRREREGANKPGRKSLHYCPLLLGSSVQCYRKAASPFHRE